MSTIRRIIYALVVWFLVAVFLWLLARGFEAVGEDITNRIANFLDKTNVIIGLLCGVYYYFFGYERFPR